MEIKVKVKFRLRGDLAKRFGLEKGGRVQQVIDKSVIDWSLPYCPWDTGVLARSPYSATVIGSGRVVYQVPWAHYQYYGEVYGPNIPVFEDNSGEPTGFFSPPGQIKHPTGRPLDYSKSQAKNGPLAGPFWVDRMKADHMSDIIKEATDAAAGRK